MVTQWAGVGEELREVHPLAVSSAALALLRNARRFMQGIPVKTVDTPTNKAYYEFYIGTSAY